jgi:hypothetical protein
MRAGITHEPPPGAEGQSRKLATGEKSRVREEGVGTFWFTSDSILGWTARPAIHRAGPAGGSSGLNVEPPAHLCQLSCDPALRRSYLLADIQTTASQAFMGHHPQEHTTCVVHELWVIVSTTKSWVFWKWNREPDLVPHSPRMETHKGNGGLCHWASGPADASPSPSI